VTVVSVHDFPNGAGRYIQHSAGRADHRERPISMENGQHPRHSGWIASPRFLNRLLQGINASGYYEGLRSYMNLPALGFHKVCGSRQNFAQSYGQPRFVHAHAGWNLGCYTRAIPTQSARIRYRKDRRPTRSRRCSHQWLRCLRAWRNLRRRWI
jgi:hypothetical protein